MHRSRTTRHWLCTLVFAAGLSLSATTWSHANEGDHPTDLSAPHLGCSVHSLRGAYAIQGSGSFVPPGSPLPYTLGSAIPVHFQNLSVFDGQGNMRTPRSVDTIGGLIEHDTPTVGTYLVRPDCTGELFLQTEHASEFGGLHMHRLFLTIVGKKVYMTFTDQGATGSCIGERIRENVE